MADYYTNSFTLHHFVHHISILGHSYLAETIHIYLPIYCKLFMSLLSSILVCLYLLISKYLMKNMKTVDLSISLLQTIDVCLSLYLSSLVCLYLSQSIYLSQLLKYINLSQYIHNYLDLF